MTQISALLKNKTDKTLKPFFFSPQIMKAHSQLFGSNSMMPRLTDSNLTVMSATFLISLHGIQFSKLQIIGK